MNTLKRKVRKSKKKNYSKTKSKPKKRKSQPKPKIGESTTHVNMVMREPMRRENSPMKAIAIANNDIALISWNVKEKIPNCLGFAIYRVDHRSQVKEPLPAWVGFEGGQNKDWKTNTTAVWPVQKFNWRDFTAKRGGFYHYEIVPMVGSYDNLKPLTDFTLTTNPIQVSPNNGSISAYFNRGILATQAVSHSVEKGPSGKPNYQELSNRIKQVGDPLRERLSGQMIDALSALLERAKKEGGQCYCALYELSDPQLLQLLIGSPYVHIILSNTGKDDHTNAAARQALHESHTDITDRMLSGSAIGHNKFVVYVDSNGKAQAVLAGSTNWTSTGLCGQTNNSLIIESQEVASIYYNYWKLLKEDDSAQGPELRRKDAQGHDLSLDSGNTKLKVWFSPNTTKKTKSKDNPTAPPDMKEVFSLMSNAKEAVMFLAFQPGKPSIIDQLRKIQQENPNLFIRGAATDAKAVQDYNTALYHRGGNADASVKPEVKVRPNGTLVAASAINDEFAYWQKELLKASPTAHAIIHDKIVVIDPFSEDCVVITGSHNLGFKASYSNDENLLIIHGNRAIAQAYTAHVLDVYDHYRFRYQLQKNHQRAFNGLKKGDSWQDKYFSDKSDIQNEMTFWASATPVESKAI